MKLITSHVSDTHNDFSFKTGSGNILFHHGDATNRGTPKEVAAFGKYLKSKLNDFDHIVFVPGNHDHLFEKDEGQARILTGIDQRIHVLINQSVELYGLKIFGSPFSRRYGDWAFMKEGEELFAEWNKIPKDVEVLITHSPPYGILDYSGWSTGNLGCNNLMYKVETEFKHLLLHGFGHIHESNGIKEKYGKVFLNAAVAGSFNISPFNAWVLEWQDKKIIDANRLED